MDIPGGLRCVQTCPEHGGSCRRRNVSGNEDRTERQTAQRGSMGPTDSYDRAVPDQRRTHRFFEMMDGLMHAQGKVQTWEYVWRVCQRSEFYTALSQQTEMSVRMFDTMFSIVMASR